MSDILTAKSTKRILNIVQFRVSVCLLISSIIPTDKDSSMVFYPLYYTGHLGIENQILKLYFKDLIGKSDSELSC